LIAFRNFDEEMKHPGVWESDQGSTSTTDNSRDNLASLYRPPFHLMFHGSFEKVKGFSLSLLLHDLSEIIYHLVLMALVNCAGYMVLSVCAEVSGISYDFVATHAAAKCIFSVLCNQGTKKLDYKSILHFL
jgi:hypothetical protein